MCKALINEIEHGRVRPYVSSIILLEVYWVLTSVYKGTKISGLGALEKIIALRGVEIIDTTKFINACALHKQTGVKLADCLIATQIPKGVGLCTYDMEFKKLPNLTIVQPSDVIDTAKESKGI